MPLCPLAWANLGTGQNEVERRVTFMEHWLYARHYLGVLGFYIY